MDSHDLKDACLGKPAVICGLGPSLKLLPEKTSCLEITCNDGWKERPSAHFTVVMDRPNPLERHNRLQGLLASPQGTVLMSSRNVKHWESWVAEQSEQWQSWWDKVVTIPVKKKVRLSPPGDWKNGLFDLFATTPYIAAQVAGFMGASVIGLIGVDLVDHPNFQSAQVVKEVDDAFRLLRESGINLVNLSPESAIASIPRVEISWFLAQAAHNQLL